MFRNRIQPQRLCRAMGRRAVAFLLGPTGLPGTGIAKAATAAPPDTAERAIEFVEMDITDLVVLHAR
jgi:hypothetical protein